MLENKRLMKTYIAVLVGIFFTLGAAQAAQAQAQAQVAKSGWRAATSEEKKLRKIFEDAKDDWDRKKDGEAQEYQCLLRWATWGMIARSDSTDLIPTISGDLTYSYADGQLSHRLSALMASARGDVDVFAAKFAKAARTFANRPDESIEEIFRSIGKCYVPPLSWAIAKNRRVTGPQIMDLAGEKADADALPAYVRSPQARKQFDRFVLDKNFVAAANLGAQLHGQNDKTTVMWNEVLRASLFAVWSGRGTALGDPLLNTLSKVWWPKYRRNWASNLLRIKRGEPTREAGNRPALHDPGAEPAWVEQERKRWQRGETNYTPCNIWNRAGC